MKVRRLIYIIPLLILVNAFLYRSYKGELSRLISPIVEEMKRNDEEVENGEIQITLGGDVMLGRSVLTKSELMGDYSYPFNEIRGFLKGSDLVFVNLETPIVEKCPRTNTGMIFCTDPKMIQGLVSSGINVVNIENNHLLNYGQEGLEETKRYLKEGGIEITGFGELAVKKIKNIRFGFLGFDFLTKRIGEKDLKLISKSKAQVDVLIVSVHWGNEYQAKANYIQKDTAEKIVNAGADVIVGHHPHWVQDIEKIGNTPVYYSLGNFVFDQMWSEETKKGLLVELTFDGIKLIREVRTPIYMSELGQPAVIGL
jgi:gamma-polyglutamate biosynthesis protein CapA